MIANPSLPSPSASPEQESIENSMKPLLSRLLFAAISLAASSDAAERANAAPPGRPNILFILTDDLGYGDLGSYGQTVIKTPRLDRMAQEGLRFTQCYAGGPKCATSRASLLTGKQSIHLDIRGNQSSHPDYEWMPLQQTETTVLRVLQDAGYATGMIGKWGLVEVDHGPESEGNPNQHGADHFYGAMDHMHANVAYPRFLWRNGQQEIIPQNNNKSKVDDLYSHDLYTHEALKFIRQHKGDEFFLYLAYSIPHANSYYTGTDRENDPRRMHVPSDQPYASMKWPQQERNFAAMITRMDRDVGTILDLLDELDLSENTIVIFSSDNGPHKQANHDVEFFNSNGDLRGHKGDLYEGGIRVPMIVRHTGTIPAPYRRGRSAIRYWPSGIFCRQRPPSRGLLLHRALTDAPSCQPCSANPKQKPSRCSGSIIPQTAKRSVSRSATATGKGSSMELAIR